MTDHISGIVQQFPNDAKLGCYIIWCYAHVQQAAYNKFGDEDFVGNRVVCCLVGQAF